MKIQYCPECKHQIESKGRFCMFCGCDLRKTPPVAMPEKTAEKPDDIRPARDIPIGLPPDDDAAYDPNKRPLKNTVFGILLIIGAVIALVIGIVNSNKKQKGNYLSTGNSFSSVCRALENSGFTKVGGEEEENGKLTQRFTGGRVYGYPTTSTIVTEEKDEITLSHYFSKSNMNTGVALAFMSMKGELNKQYGKPVYQADDNSYYSWEQNGKEIALMRAGDVVFIMESIQK